MVPMSVDVVKYKLLVTSDILLLLTLMLSVKSDKIHLV